ncbi:MAG: hypothetical protein H6633_15190 [Anaerolineales bacterium]|nr:hypothetical protein [Anaerolineales bacterium]
MIGSRTPPDSGKRPTGGFRLGAAGKGRTGVGGALIFAAGAAAIGVLPLRVTSTALFEGAPVVASLGITSMGAGSGAKASASPAGAAG